MKLRVGGKICYESYLTIFRSASPPRMPSDGRHDLDSRLSPTDSQYCVLLKKDNQPSLLVSLSPVQRVISNSLTTVTVQAHVPIVEGQVQQHHLNTARIALPIMSLNFRTPRCKTIITNHTTLQRTIILNLWSQYRTHSVLEVTLPVCLPERRKRNVAGIGFKLLTILY